MDLKIEPGKKGKKRKEILPLPLTLFGPGSKISKQPTQLPIFSIPFFRRPAQLRTLPGQAEPASSHLLSPLLYLADQQTPPPLRA